MASVRIEDTKFKDGRAGFRLFSPYHPEFPERARALGGTWNGETFYWLFDARDRDRVRALCREIYGEDPDGEPAPLVDLRLRITDSDRSYIIPPPTMGSMFLLGRQIARRPGRDAPVRLGPGVVVLQGGFSGSGGSAKHPSLATLANTILEIRDVPAPLVEQLRAELQQIADRVAAIPDRANEAEIYRTALEIVHASDA